MKEKTRKILIMAVMAALIISLMAASLCYTFTYGRYSGGRLDDNSTYDDLIDFVGATAFEVSTPDEFVNAIENGYSYIKIDENAEKPFVINNDVANVYTNLVIDVNGNVVVRNSRNPLLDVRRSISVVLVYDSSEEATGGFYNPVGSALQTSGGSLTVGSGSYMSGPNSTVNANLPTSRSVSLVTRGDRTSSYGTAQAATLPILTETTGDKYLPENWTDTEGGDQIKEDTYLLYTEVKNAFVGKGETSDGIVPDPDEPSTGDPAEEAEEIAFQDGQLYVNCEKFTVDDTQTTYSADIFAPDSNVASCDFYYYYPIEENGAYSEDAGTVDSPKTYAVVYGYNDVKGLAEDSTDDTTAVDLREKGLAWPYAAIRSVEDGTVGGVTHARGGTFTTNFGTVNTYGIYSVGGTMTVGTDSESTPPEFTATGEGTCIGMSAGNGDTLTIASGSFSSEVGDTILMSGGEMTVTGGTFEKNASSGSQSTEVASNGSAIRVEGGTLNINGTQTGNTKSVTFTIKGSNVNGITAYDGTVEAASADFTFNSGSGGSGGTMNYGIAASGGTIKATSCVFTIPGNDNNGIVASGGQITASSSTFTLDGESNNGIYSIVEDISSDTTDFDAQADGCTFNITGSDSHGVYATGGRTRVQGGFINMATQAAPGNDNFGIEVASGEVIANGCAITVYGTYSAGVLARGGIVNLGSYNDVSANITVHLGDNNTSLSSSAVSSESADGVDGVININGSTYIWSDGLGITARGEVHVTDGTAQVITTRGTGVYVNNGELNVDSGAKLEVTSTIMQGCSWVTPPETVGEPISQIYNGVFVQGGSLTSNGTLNVDFTGVESDDVATGNNSNLDYDTSWIDDSWVRVSDNVYRNFQVKSYAVRVEGRDVLDEEGNPIDQVTIAAGTITNSIGGGVLVTGGGLTLGQGTSGPTVNATAGEGIVGEGEDLYYDDYRIEGNTTGNWAYSPPIYGGDAVKVDGGTLTIHGGEYTANYGNGILVSNGTATVNGGTFTGNDDRDYYGGLYTGAGSNYGLKVLGGSATVKGGTFSSNGGGVFIMGTETNNQQTTITAATIEVSGATAVSLWNYANVVFGTENGNNSLLTASAESTGLAVEKTSDGAEQTITINSGTFRGETVASNKNGIWYGNDATMTINGGIFTGGSSGLFIGVDPGSDKLKISSGTFTGNSGAISGNNLWSISTNEIIARGSWCFDGNDNAVCDREYNGRQVRYDYFQVGGGGQKQNGDSAENYSVALNDTVYNQNGGRLGNFNSIGTIVVQTGNQITNE